jgi:hypothetical protein
MIISVRIRIRCHNLRRICAESVPKTWQIRQPESPYPAVLKRLSRIQLAPYFTPEITKTRLIRLPQKKFITLYNP